MGRRKSDTPAEQLELIDLQGPEAKEIKKAARQYKDAVSQRTEWLADELKHKAKILELVKDANIKPLEDGSIKFRVDGAVISIKPRDELVRVRFDGDDAAEGDD